MDKIENLMKLIKNCLHIIPKDRSNCKTILQMFDNFSIDKESLKRDTHYKEFSENLEKNEILKTFFLDKTSWNT